MFFYKLPAEGLSRLTIVPSVIALFYLKEGLKSYTIISTGNETDARIHGTIYANHQKGKRDKVFQATRPYVRCKDVEKQDDRVGQPTYCKP